MTSSHGAELVALANHRCDRKSIPVKVGLPQDRSDGGVLVWGSVVLVLWGVQFIIPREPRPHLFFNSPYSS